MQALSRPTVTLPADECRTPKGWSLQRDLVLNPPGEQHLGEWRMHRCIFRVPADGTTRGVAIDIGDPVSNWELGAFPYPTMMSFEGSMEPLSRKVDLDAGKAEIFVFSDPTVPTATTVMAWNVKVNDSQSRRVSVTVPDDRREVATFPQPKSHLGAVLVRWMLSITRTQAEQLRKFGVTPKDEDFLLSTAGTVINSWKPGFTS